MFAWIWSLWYTSGPEEAEHANRDDYPEAHNPRPVLHKPSREGPAPGDGGDHLRRARAGGVLSWRLGGNMQRLDLSHSGPSVEHGVREIG